MGLRARTRRLEKRMGLRDKDKPCPECGGRIVYEEILEDGTVTYPQGEPCEACGRGGVGRRARPNRRGVGRNAAGFGPVGAGGAPCVAAPSAWRGQQSSTSVSLFAPIVGRLSATLETYLSGSSWQSVRTRPERTVSPIRSWIASCRIRARVLQTQC